jgi:hypothetical protein
MVDGASSNLSRQTCWQLRKHVDDGIGKTRRFDNRPHSHNRKSANPNSTTSFVVVGPMREHHREKRGGAQFNIERLAIYIGFIAVELGDLQ